MTTEYNAFHGDKQFKSQMLIAAQQHRKADEYISGIYHDADYHTFHGCSVGCSLYDVEQIRGVDAESVDYEDHGLLAESLGIPEWFTRLQDTLFEGVSNERRPKLTGELINAIPVGFSDWQSVNHKLHLFIQQQNLKRINELQIDDDLRQQIKDAINAVIKLHQNALNTGTWDQSAARSADSAARSAAYSVDSAELAARSARLAAYSAAYSAADSAADSAAYSAGYEKIADQIISLLCAQS